MATPVSTSDSDGDTRSLEVKLIRLDDNQLPARWWERQNPRVRLRQREVAEALAPQSLTGESGLPPIEREADRAPHLQFWASVLQAVAADWLHGGSSLVRQRGGSTARAGWPAGVTQTAGSAASMCTMSGKPGNPHQSSRTHRQLPRQPGSATEPSAAVPQRRQRLP